MKHLYIVRSSQLTQPDMDLSVQEFVKATGKTADEIREAVHSMGGLPLSAYKKEQMEQIQKGAIYLYKIGKLTNEEFLSQINQTLNCNLDMPTFEKCWNAMCTMTRSTFSTLQQIENLQKKYGFDISVVANTNPMHDSYIRQQFAAKVPSLKLTHSLSYVNGVFDKLEEPVSSTSSIQSIDLRDEKVVILQIKIFEMCYIESILANIFTQDAEYISKFKSIAREANITLDRLLLGRVDAKVAYTAEDIKNILNTLAKLINQQFSTAKIKPVEKPSYTASAGAPGSGKTFAIEKMFDINVSNGQFPVNAVYIGPDSVVLPQMDAYLHDCEEYGPEMAYTKWRDASNFIANFMLVKAINDKVNIVHDTTSTSSRVKTILDVLGKCGYTRNLHFYMANKEQRAGALDHRKEKLGYAMVTTADAVNKVAAAFERIADNSYIGRVESLVFYAQQGKFWNGQNNPIEFAMYEPAANPSVQILPYAKPWVDSMLKQMSEKENLKPELVQAMQELVRSWVVLEEKPRAVLQLR